MNRVLHTSSLFLLMATNVFAGPLTWEATVEETARANSELNASRSSFQAADYQANAAYAGFLPQVSGAVDYTHSTLNSYSASLTATQNLFSGFQDRAKVDQAKASLKVASATFDSTRAKVSYDLKSAFSGLVFAKNSVKLTADIVKRREANFRLVQLRFENGRENRGSVLLAKAYLEQSKYEYLQAKNALETAHASLARVLGRDSSEEIEIAGTVPVSVPPENLDLKKLSAETPVYRQSAAQEESADAGILNARSAFFPNLNVTGTSGRTGPDWFPETSKWSLGVGLTIPLFNGGKDYYGTKAATQTWKAALSTRENSLRQSLVLLKQNHTAFIEAVQKLEVDRSFREASESREKIAKEKYNNGLLTFDDWDIIENDLILREKAFIQSERERIVAEASWEQALGKGVIP